MIPPDFQNAYLSANCIILRIQSRDDLAEVAGIERCYRIAGPVTIQDVVSLGTELQALAFAESEYP